uniref:ANK_REP_REGION domain-containing protein n=1 Tax=Macrostomum lignano TaxID=282301 RepID=A0A1I8FTA1_9PLAT
WRTSSAPLPAEQPAAPQLLLEPRRRCQPGSDRLRSLLCSMTPQAELQSTSEPDTGHSPLIKSRSWHGNSTAVRLRRRNLTAVSVGGHTALHLSAHARRLRLGALPARRPGPADGLESAGQSRRCDLATREEVRSACLPAAGSNKQRAAMLLRYRLPNQFAIRPACYCWRNCVIIKRAPSLRLHLRPPPLPQPRPAAISGPKKLPLAVVPSRDTQTRSHAASGRTPSRRERLSAEEAQKRSDKIATKKSRRRSQNCAGVQSPSLGSLRWVSNAVNWSERSIAQTLQQQRPQSSTKAGNKDLQSSNESNNKDSNHHTKVTTKTSNHQTNQTQQRPQTSDKRTKTSNHSGESHNKDLKPFKRKHNKDLNLLKRQ